MGHILTSEKLLYDLDANYNFDPELIELVTSLAKLIGDPVIPYAHYPANTVGSSSTLLDTSPNVYDGTITGDQTFVTGKLNNAKYFDGSTFINLGANFDFARTQPLTFEFWIQTTDDSGYIFQRLTSPGGQLKGLGINLLSGKIRFLIYGNNANRLSVVTADVINDGNFYHIIISYDGSSLAAGVTIFINNVAAPLTTVEDNLNSPITNGADLILGGYGGSNLTGLLDEIVIYTKVLDSTERTFRYNEGTGTELIINGYSLDAPKIVNETELLFTAPIDSFAVIKTTPTYTAIQYQLSSDNGQTWKYYSGSWTEITASQLDSWYFTNESNTETEISNNIATLANSGNLKIRAFLSTTRGYATPELDEIEITYHLEEEIAVYDMTSKLS